MLKTRPRSIDVTGGLLLFIGLAMCIGVAKAVSVGPRARPPGMPSSRPAANVDEVDPAQITTPEVATPAEFVKHESADGSFAIWAPPTWKEKAPPLSAKLLLTAEQKGVSVNVVINQAVPGETLKSAVEQVPALIQARLKGFKLIKSDFVHYRGRTWGRIQYEVPFPNGITLRFLQTVWINHGKVVVVTMTAPATMYESMATTGEQIVASFEETEAGATMPARG